MKLTNLSFSFNKAVKVINKYLLTKKKKTPQRLSNGEIFVGTFFDNAEREIEIITRISHENLVNCLDLIENKESEKIYVILEYCEKGQLVEVDEETRTFYINKHFKTFNPLHYREKTLKKFTKELLSAVAYRHCLKSSLTERHSQGYKARQRAYNFR